MNDLQLVRNPNGSLSVLPDQDAFLIKFSPESYESYYRDLFEVFFSLGEEPHAKTWILDLSDFEFVPHSSWNWYYVYFIHTPQVKVVLDEVETLVVVDPESSDSQPLVRRFIEHISEKHNLHSLHCENVEEALAAA